MSIFVALVGRRAYSSPDSERLTSPVDFSNASK